MSEVKISDLKVGQEFVKCYPIYWWFMDFAKVDIEYSEWKITKLNEKSYRVQEKKEDGSWNREQTWKLHDDSYFPTKEEALNNVLKNSQKILDAYNKKIAKYTEIAFQHWYLKAQKQMVEITYKLAKKNKLNYEGLKSVQKEIEQINNELNKRLKKTKEVESK